MVSDVFETPNVQAHMEGLRDRTVVGDKGSYAEVLEVLVYFALGRFLVITGAVRGALSQIRGSYAAMGWIFLKFFKRFRSSYVATRANNRSKCSPIPNPKGNGFRRKCRPT